MFKSTRATTVKRTYCQKPNLILFFLEPFVSAFTFKRNGYCAEAAFLTVVHFSFPPGWIDIDDTNTVVPYVWGFVRFSDLRACIYPICNTYNHTCAQSKYIKLCDQSFMMDENGGEIRLSVVEERVVAVRIRNL